MIKCLFKTGSHVPFLEALSTVPAGPPKDCQKRKRMRLGFLGRAGTPDDRLLLRKIRSWEKKILLSSKHALSDR